jgi:hypothetical protein
VVRIISKSGIKVDKLKFIKGINRILSLQLSSIVVRVLLTFETYEAVSKASQIAVKTVFSDAKTGKLR